MPRKPPPLVRGNPSAHPRERGDPSGPAATVRERLEALRFTLIDTGYFPSVGATEAFRYAADLATLLGPSGAPGDYLAREAAQDLLHDSATDDPNNHDCRPARGEPASSVRERLEAALAQYDEADHGNDIVNFAATACRVADAARTLLAQPTVGREEVARFLEPNAFATADALAREGREDGVDGWVTLKYLLGGPGGRIARAYRRADELISLLAPSGVPGEPIPMLLYCPNCGEQHIDEPEDESGADRWMNPPHRSHLCRACGCIWRPADVPTTGVAEVATTGKADTWNRGERASGAPGGWRGALARAEELEAMRNKWLMATPDKDHTPWAIVTRAIETLRALAAPEPVEERVGEIEQMVDKAFAGHGAALRRREDPPIPGEPYVSMEAAKKVAVRLLLEARPAPEPVEEGERLRAEDKELEELSVAAARAAIAALTQDTRQLRVALLSFLRMSASIASDLISAHAARSDGASEWMREEDRDLRRDFDKAVGEARSALAAADHGGST